MARQPDETDGGNAVDRVVQRVAVGLSRRSFLGRLGKLGLGAGLGLAGVGSALASSCNASETKNCSPRLRDGCCNGNKQRYKVVCECCTITGCRSIGATYSCSSEFCIG